MLSVTACWLSFKNCLCEFIQSQIKQYLHYQIKLYKCSLMSFACLHQSIWCDFHILKQCSFSFMKWYLVQIFTLIVWSLIQILNKSSFLNAVIFMSILMKHAETANDLIMLSAVLYKIQTLMFHHSFYLNLQIMIMTMMMMMIMMRRFSKNFLLNHQSLSYKIQTTQH